MVVLVRCVNDSPVNKGSRIFLQVLEGCLLVLYCGPSQGRKCTTSVTLVTGIRDIAAPRAHHDIIFIGLVAFRASRGEEG